MSLILLHRDRVNSTYNELLYKLLSHFINQSLYIIVLDTAIRTCVLRVSTFQQVEGQEKKVII